MIMQRKAMASKDADIIASEKVLKRAAKRALEIGFKPERRYM
jgi:hypothetical protein